MSDKIIKILIISVLILVSGFFSFYKLANLYHLDFDQERDYGVVQKMVNEHKPTLIGPRAVGESGFHLGPWYYYFLVPFYLFFRGNPIFGAYTAAVVNVVTVIYLFWLLARRTSPFVALFGSLIWLSELHRTTWNVMFVPLFTFAIVDTILATRSSINLFLIAFLISAGITFHPQFAFFIPVLFILFVRVIRNVPLNEKLRFLIQMIIGGLLPIAPLILFDFLHGFINTKSAFTFTTLNTGAMTTVLNSLQFSYTQFVRSSSAFLPIAQDIRGIVLILILGLLIYLNRKNRYLLMLMLITITSILSLGFYKNTHWPEYYQTVAVLCLLVAGLITLGRGLAGKVILLILAIIIIPGSLLNLIKYDDPRGYNYRRDLMLYILESAKPFNRPNITYDFPLGEGLGFGTIRDYYEVKTGPHNPSIFFVSYSENKKQNSTKKDFGIYAVSKNWTTDHI